VGHETLVYSTVRLLFEICDVTEILAYEKEIVSIMTSLHLDPIILLDMLRA